MDVGISKLEKHRNTIGMIPLQENETPPPHNIHEIARVKVKHKESILM